ncbi:unnamed protein product [Amoebophrya sp. A25]|nr:unnamed protein product [Amoebophrya sp. A25]|eukprot:GSA25T00001847001.1
MYMSFLKELPVDFIVVLVCTLISLKLFYLPHETRTPTASGSSEQEKTAALAVTIRESRKAPILSYDEVLVPSGAWPWRRPASMVSTRTVQATSLELDQLQNEEVSDAQRGDETERIETTDRQVEISYLESAETGRRLPDFDEENALHILERLWTRCSEEDRTSTRLQNGIQRPKFVPPTRVTGSWANEVCMRDAILNEVRKITGKASDGSKSAPAAGDVGYNVEIEIEVTSSGPGSFHLDFLEGIINSYDKLTNIVVRVPASPDSKGIGIHTGSDGRLPDNSSLLAHCEEPRAILLGAHFDASTGSHGVDDALAMVAMLLEILRVLHSFDNRVGLQSFDTIFLFNGAEEPILSAAHAFISQDKRRKNICAFLNVESAGSGGRDLVNFGGAERGGHSWLADSYSRGVRFPNANGLWQFLAKESRALPGETDSRIFREYGMLPGADFFNVGNGYVYHTDRDDPRHVWNHRGDLQRYGSNVLALFRAMTWKLDRDRRKVHGRDGEMVEAQNLEDVWSTSRHTDVLHLGMLFLDDDSARFWHTVILAVVVVQIAMAVKFLSEDIDKEFTLLAAKALRSEFLRLPLRFFGLIFLAAVGIWFPVEFIGGHTHPFYMFPPLHVVLFVFPILELADTTIFAVENLSQANTKAVRMTPTDLMKLRLNTAWGVCLLRDAAAFLYMTLFHSILVVSGQFLAVTYLTLLWIPTLTTRITIVAWYVDHCADARTPTKRASALCALVAAPAWLITVAALIGLLDSAFPLLRRMPPTLSANLLWIVLISLAVFLAFFFVLRPSITFIVEGPTKPASRSVTTSTTTLPSSVHHFLSKTCFFLVILSLVFYLPGFRDDFTSDRPFLAFAYHTEHRFCKPASTARTTQSPSSRTASKTAGSPREVVEVSSWACAVRAHSTQTGDSATLQQQTSDGPDVTYANGIILGAFSRGGMDRPGMQFAGSLKGLPPYLQNTDTATKERKGGLPARLSWGATPHYFPIYQWLPRDVDDTLPYIPLSLREGGADRLTWRNTDDGSTVHSDVTSAGEESRPRPMRIELRWERINYLRRAELQGEEDEKKDGDAKIVCFRSGHVVTSDSVKDGCTSGVGFYRTRQNDEVAFATTSPRMLTENNKGVELEVEKDGEYTDVLRTHLRVSCDDGANIRAVIPAKNLVNWSFSQDQVLPGILHPVSRRRLPPPRSDCDCHWVQHVQGGHWKDGEGEANGAEMNERNTSPGTLSSSTKPFTSSTSTRNSVDSRWRIFEFWVDGDIESFELLCVRSDYMTDAAWTRIANRIPPWASVTQCIVDEPADLLFSVIRPPRKE